MAHASDSSEQRSAEPEILKQLSLAEDIGLRPEKLALSEGARVDVDGVSADRSMLVEVFAHQGALKGGQYGKVAKDALKLITLGRSYPKARLVLAFGDAAAAKSVSGRSWLAEAIRTWGIEIYVAELDDDLRQGVLAAQTRQVMVNVEVGDLAELTTPDIEPD